MFGEIFGRRDQHRQLHKFLQLVQITKMFHCGCQRVERTNVRGFLAFLDGKIFTQAARNGQLSIHHRKRAA